jgi:hypothetical protein
LKVLLLVAFTLFNFSFWTTSSYASKYNLGPSPRNEYIAIDTFFNTTKLTRAHFKDVIQRNIQSKINLKLHQSNVPGKSWDSIRIASCRIVIVDATAKVLWHDSTTTNTLPTKVVKLLAESPILTRILIDKTVAYFYYNNPKLDSTKHNLIPMFYELHE